MNPDSYTLSGLVDFLQKKKDLYLSSQKKIDRLAEVSSIITRKSFELESIENELRPLIEIGGSQDLYSVQNDLKEASRIKAIVSDIKRKIDAGVVLLEDLAVKQISEEKVFETISFLLDKTTLRYVQSLESTLNKVYSSVFQRSDKGVTLKISESRGKKVLTLSITKQIDSETGIDLDLKPGSVTTLLGTILNLYYIIFNNLPRMVMLDETFASLDDIIISRFFETLKVFVDELGFSFLIVTQDPAVSALASRLYYMSTDGLKLVRG